MAGQIPTNSVTLLQTRAVTQHRQQWHKAAQVLHPPGTRPLKSCTIHASHLPLALRGSLCRALGLLLNNQLPAVKTGVGTTRW